MSDILINGTFAPNGSFKLADGKDVSKVPIIAANLSALENYVYTYSMVVGQWGYATDTGKMYILTTIGAPPGTPHTWTELSTEATGDVFPSNILYVKQFGSDKAETYYPGGTTGTGFINVAADFPAGWGGVTQGDCWTIPNGVTVTDNNPAKTNTGQTFIGPLQIAADKTNTRWIERNGLTIDTCVSSISTAVYLASFISNPPIYVLDKATYTFGDGQLFYSPLIAPSAKIICLGYALNFSPSVLLDTLEINYIGGSGGFLCLSSGTYMVTGKYAYFNGTPAPVGIFVNNGSGDLILNFGEINGLLSTNQTLSAQGRPIYANIGKFTGKATVTMAGSGGAITFNTLNISNITVNDTLGSIYFPAMKRVNSSTTYGYPYMKPMIASDAIVTDTKFIGANQYNATQILGYFNDGTYTYQSYGTAAYSIFTSGDGKARIKCDLTSSSQSMEFLDELSPQHTVGSMSTSLLSDWICNVPYQLNGGVKDTNVTTAINIGDASNTSFNTTNKTIVGAINEVLSDWSGDSTSIKQTIGQIYNGETQLYFDSSVIIAAGSENNNPIYTFTTSPDGSAESTVSRLVSSGSSPVLMAGFQYANANMNYYGLYAGITIGKIWAYLSALHGGTTTELLQNIMSIRSYNGVMSTSGSGSSRNVTATTASFFASDANADPTIASYLKTPKGLYQIIGYVSSTQVIINVPAGYLNEFAISYNKWFKLYQMTSGDIQYTTPAKEITFFSTPKGEYSPATSIDWQPNNQVGILLFGTTTYASGVIVNLTFNGSSKYSHIDFPGLIPIKSHGFPVETNAALGARRTRTVSGAGSFNFNFLIPEECERILSAYLICYPSPGAAGSARDIDLTVEYNNNLGESITQYTANNLTSTYDLTAYANNRYELHFESLLSSAKGGTEGGVKVDQNSIGGNMDYTEIVVEFISR